MILQGDFKAELFWKVKSINLKTSTDGDKTSLLLYITHAGLASEGEGNTERQSRTFGVKQAWLLYVLTHNHM